MKEHHRNITVAGVVVHRPVGRLVGLGLLGVPASSLHGLRLADWQVAAPLQWLNGGDGSMATTPEAGSNFVEVVSPSTITGVVIDAVRLGRKLVAADSDWALTVLGDTHVNYTS